MSSVGLKSTGIPHSVYTYPLDVVIYLRDKLGVAEGQFDFAQPFKHAENTMDLIETVLEYEKQGLLTNDFSKTPCKTKLDQNSIDKMRQLWDKQTYLIITFDKMESTKKTLEEIVFVRPHPRHPRHDKCNLCIHENQEYKELPSLSALKPREDQPLNRMLILIGEAVPEREAYEGEDPQQLTDIGGCYYDRGFGVKQPWFTSQEDIQNSPNYTKRVGQNYYDNTRKRLYKKWKKLSIILKVNIVTLAKEIQGFDYEREDTAQDVLLD